MVRPAVLHPLHQPSTENVAKAEKTVKKNERQIFGPGLQFRMDSADLKEMESPTYESPPIPPEWLAEFEAAARRPLETRLRYAFIHTYKPVLDDEPFRAFATMEEYRRWCETNLPDWLGYGRV
jgi:hypothetical protein